MSAGGDGNTGPWLSRRYLHFGADRSLPQSARNWQETTMRKVVVNEWMTLDGVMQAPGYKDEDPTGGFEHGGWHLRYFDDMSRG